MNDTAAAHEPAREAETREAGWRKALAPVVLCLAIAAAYSNSFHGEFIFDDHQSIPDNPSIRSLTPLRGVLFPQNKGGRTIDSRPVVNLSLAINYALGELDVRGYHVFNLLVHLAATLALYGVVRRTLLLPRWEESLRRSATPLAFVVALLWGVHPLQTESVTYLIQRAESMAGLFYLVTLYGAIRSWSSPRQLLWTLLSVVACALGMATKEVVATAPLVVLLYDRVFLYRSFTEMLRSRRWLYAGLFGTWLVLVALMAAGQGRGKTAGFRHGVTPLDYLLTQCWAIPHYLRLTVLPWPLVLDYGNPLIKEPVKILSGLAVLTMLFVGTAAGFRFQPWIGFLGTSFFLILAPSSSFVPIITQTIAEHRMYLPMAAVIVFLVLAGRWLWERWQQKRTELGEKPLPAAVPALAVLTIAIVLALLTWQRNAVYRTAESIWRDNMAKSPGNVRSHANMADIFIDAGNPEAAIRELDICVQMKPDSAAHRYNRGTLLLRLKRYEAAIDDYNEALKLDPSDPATWHNRGVAWQDLGKHDQAIADFNAALERDPKLAVAYFSRALSYRALGQLAKADADLRQYQALGGRLEQ